jgi:hypothetical protein
MWKGEMLMMRTLTMALIGRFLEVKNVEKVRF